jgi:CBS domain-containing protein
LSRKDGDDVIGSEVAAQASGLVVRRQGHVILDGLTFTIPRGQVTGLLGPSGCGKSTLMRTLVGVQMIDAGRVELLGLPAGEIMDPHPATVRPEAAVAEAARLMSRHQARFLLVTDADGKLLGVVNARDLLRVFLRPDEAIMADIVGDVLPRYIGTDPVMVDVEVIDGVVRLTGELERKSMLTAVRPAVRAVDGVIDVVGRLGYAIDDTSRPPRPTELDEPETPRSPVAAGRLT